MFIESARFTRIAGLALPIIGGMTSQIMLNMVVVISIMHFWYDGFIWSVRKKQVT